jgi:hypothetical protein
VGIEMVGVFGVEIGAIRGISGVRFVGAAGTGTVGQ